MNLCSVYDMYKKSPEILYELLKERTEEQSISHKKMPSWEKHLVFVFRRPYQAWYLAVSEDVEEGVVGSVYLSRSNEVGLFLFKKYQGKGYGEKILNLLIEKHPVNRIVANINPNNLRSIAFFEKMGWKQIQVTYEKTFHRG